MGKCTLILFGISFILLVLIFPNPVFPLEQKGIKLLWDRGRTISESKGYREKAGACSGKELFIGLFLQFPFI
ncbi:hypothetical protein B5V88_13960 [Heyndrickxia sporothermodurans]|uniref:Uncharacterized protein n=1 Tax=Heyndrickxia sporothermodurans TaxID=46224 RepID=A0A150L5D2_9BACI|nr:hypothetical protein B4102_2957 [Heyndrickxia sporothermodurans]PTY75810.1 hypothetical protein B5V88_13960 [Heyndrickxia sporothermodurans]PTY85540.1 hypothetical protein B5V91_09305 [Heyndrickxia sporothermodurans]PTY86071.1 hypothetical protein B5V90_12685 [Heyndrickxia sporothermodurans]